MNSATKYLSFILALSLISFFLALRQSRSNELTIVACNVGQGDAYLINHKRYQVLIDGGPNDDVISCMSKYMPFFDRRLEAVVMTHPQSDHYQGLIEVFERYNVQVFLAPALDSGNEGFKVLKELVGGSGARVINPTNETTIVLGLIHLDVVHPTDEYLANNNLRTDTANVLGAYKSEEDPNNFSIVLNLKYGKFDALFTGDIGPEIIDGVIATGEIRDVEYIKVPHHGSKNGLTGELLEKSMPEIAVISSGKNPWGHPHKETLELLNEKNIETFRTDMGDVVVKTDGASWRVVK